MAGKKTNFKRGGSKKIARRRTESPTNVDAKASDMKGFDSAAALESAKNLEEHPMAVERIRHLQRQAKNAGISIKEEKLRKEQKDRLEYNANLSNIDLNAPFTQTFIPRNKAIVRLFKKPIFELNGFLKPDLLKHTTEGGGVTYTENRFPYLEGGVVVNQTGMEDMFGEGKNYVGSAISLSLNCKLHKYIYFIDKTDIKPDTFEGYVLIPLHEIESVVALPGAANYDDMVGELTGLRANKLLQEEVAAEKAKLDAKAEAIKAEAKVEAIAENIDEDVKEEVKDAIRPLVLPNGSIWTDGSHS